MRSCSDKGGLKIQQQLKSWLCHRWHTTKVWQYSLLYKTDSKITAIIINFFSNYQGSKNFTKIGTPLPSIWKLVHKLAQIHGSRPYFVEPHLIFEYLQIQTHQNRICQWHKDSPSHQKHLMEDTLSARKPPRVQIFLECLRTNDLRVHLKFADAGI